ncbi:MAG: YceI family protein [Bdellovibrionales bacterium]|nr:YceI family protein [Bdellovibrionales bacterium]
MTTRFRLLVVLCLLVQLVSMKVRADSGSEIRFKVTLNPAGSFVAKSSAVTGSASSANSGYSASKVELDLRTLKTGIELRDRHMTKKYFETDKYPKATLTQAVAKNGRFKAQLQVHGKTQVIEGSYEVKKAPSGGGFIEARFKTSLSAFEIEEANYMGVGVEDEIEVFAKIPIQKGGA